MCILAATSFITGSNVSCPTLRKGFFYALYALTNSGVQPRELVVMANSALSNEACQREVGAVFFCLQDKIITLC